MKIQHIRNATTLIELGARKILIDPMLADAGTMPGFKMFGGGKRNNPLVDLPPNAMDTFELATDILITHEHPDHLDPGAVAWIKKRDLPVWCGSVDVENLRSKGLNANTVTDSAFGIPAEEVEATHGHGLAGWLMGPVTGFYLAPDDGPTVYVVGDSVMTDAIRSAVRELRPQVIIAPAGGANFGIGKSIIFSEDELMELTSLASESVMVFNHLEALDHCATTRVGLLRRMKDAGFADRVFAPNDGEDIEVTPVAQVQVKPRQSPARVPGFQKRLTARFAGT